MKNTFVAISCWSCKELVDTVMSQWQQGMDQEINNQWGSRGQCHCQLYPPPFPCSGIYVTEGMSRISHNSYAMQGLLVIPGHFRNFMKSLFKKISPDIIFKYNSWQGEGVNILLLNSKISTTGPISTKLNFNKASLAKGD